VAVRYKNRGAGLGTQKETCAHYRHGIADAIAKYCPNSRYGEDNLWVNASHKSKAPNALAKRLCGPQRMIAQGSSSRTVRLSGYRSADSMMARAHDAHPKAETRLQPIHFASINKQSGDHLQGESIHA